ncbi:MAG: hypothetical protein LBP76_02375, partial [Treponema sp.]|nr:hypothetical protein [Treponema sp.]
AEAQAIKIAMEADTIKTPKSFFIHDTPKLPFDYLKQTVFYEPFLKTLRAKIRPEKAAQATVFTIKAISILHFFPN